MTTLRQSAIKELEKLPEDKLIFIIQIMQGVNGLYTDTKGYIAAHSICNMFFISRKDFTVKERREILTNLCSIFEVEGIDKQKLLSGFEIIKYYVKRMKAPKEGTLF